MHDREDNRQRHAGSSTGCAPAHCLQPLRAAARPLALLISAVLLLLSEPWLPPDRAPHPTGPEIAGLVLGAVALYILRVALIGFLGLK